MKSIWIGVIPAGYYHPLRCPDKEVLQQALNKSLMGQSGEKMPEKLFKLGAAHLKYRLGIL